MIINNAVHESVGLHASSIPLRSRLEKLKKNISCESKENEGGSKLDDETKQLVVDVLELLKSSSGSATENGEDLPNTKTKTFDEMTYDSYPTESFSLQSPSTFSSASSASSFSSKSSPSSRRKQRTVQLSPSSRKERVLQLSPSRGNQRTEEEEEEAEIGTMKLASPSRRKDRSARSPSRRRKDRAAKSSSPSRLKERSPSRRRKASSSPSRLKKAASKSPSRLKKERKDLSTSPKVQEEDFLDDETTTKKSQDKSSKKRRGKKPKGAKLRESDEKLKPVSSKASTVVDESQTSFQNVEASLGDFNIHELNYRQLEAKISRDTLANLARGQGKNSSSSNSNSNSIDDNVNAIDECDDLFSSAKVEKRGNTSSKNSLPRRSSVKSSLRKTRSPSIILSEDDVAPSLSERGTKKTMTLKSSDSASKRSPKRNVRRTKSDSHALPRPRPFLSSPHPRRKSSLEEMVCNKPSSNSHSSLKRSGVGRTKSEASLPTSMSTSTSLRKQKSPPTIPPPPLLLGESSNHLTLFLDEDKDEEEYDSQAVENSSQIANSNSWGSCSSSNRDKRREELVKSESFSSVSSSGSNDGAGGKVQNARTHELYTGFFLLSEGSDGRAANLKHGFGKTKFSDGRVFEGTYDHGVMMEGKMTYAEDANNSDEERRSYVGKFDVDGFRSGKGIYTTATYTYLGEFHRDEMHGSGILIYHTIDNPNYGSKSCRGGRFVGYWKQGLRHGPGKEVGVDGTVQREGLWKKGRFCAAV